MLINLYEGDIIFIKAKNRLEDIPKDMQSRYTGDETFCYEVKMTHWCHCKQRFIQLTRKILKN